MREDVKTLVALTRLIREFRPAIVHTHTAKAGALGRLAARAAMGRQTIVIHTYHGHVLKGYLDPRRHERSAPRSRRSRWFRTVSSG